MPLLATDVRLGVVGGFERFLPDDASTEVRRPRLNRVAPGVAGPDGLGAKGFVVASLDLGGWCCWRPFSLFGDCPKPALPSSSARSFIFASSAGSKGGPPPDPCLRRTLSRREARWPATSSSPPSATPDPIALKAPGANKEGGVSSLFWLIRSIVLLDDYFCTSLLALGNLH